MNKRITISLMVVLTLAAAFMPASQMQAQPLGLIKDYGDITINQWGNGKFGEVWDLTRGDLTLEYTLDMSGIATAGWSVVEVGLREVGAPNLDPNYKGGWMQSNYIYGTSNPTSQNNNDMHLLSKHGWAEQYYDAEGADTIVTPYWSNDNYGFWFDRDGVDEWQEELWGMEGIYDTGGVYEISITYHAVDATKGTMFATINGVRQGLYVGGWKNAEPEFYPAGRTFTGDMSRMQFFYGRGGGGGTVALSDVTVEGELAPTRVLLWNDDNNNDKLNAGEEITAAEDSAISVEISGKGSFKTGDLLDLPAGTSVSYRLRRGGIAGPWLHATFPDDLVDGDWQLEFATVYVTLFNDTNGDDVIQDEEKLSDPHSVEVSGVGSFTTSQIFHVPPDTELSYRMKRGGIAGPWLKETFAAGYLDWQLEFATIHVTLFNDTNGDDVIQDEEKLDDPHSVEVSGVGNFTTSQTFHVPPDTELSYRMKRGGIAGPWLKKTFAAGYLDWQLEFATIHVTLFNDTNGDDVIQDEEKLSDPHSVEVSGVGSFTTSQIFHVPPDTELSYRMKRGGIAGPWLKETFAAGYLDWQLEFATVYVTLFNDTNGDDVIQDEEKLSDPHSVEVSGVGNFTTSQTFHVPPDTELSYRMKRGGIAGPWLKKTFAAGYLDWQLEFATIHVTLFNGAESLGSPHAVEISGVGQFTTGDFVHLPPDTDVSYRLKWGGISGPWQTQQFAAGLLEWKLEFATVTFKFDLPANAAALMSTEISGYGTVPHNGKAHLPPGVTLSYRAKRGGWATDWFQQSFQAGDGMVIWRLGPTYVSPMP